MQNHRVILYFPSVHSELRPSKKNPTTIKLLSFSLLCPLWSVIHCNLPPFWLFAHPFIQFQTLKHFSEFPTLTQSRHCERGLLVLLFFWMKPLHKLISFFNLQRLNVLKLTSAFVMSLCGACKLMKGDIFLFDWEKLLLGIEFIDQVQNKKNKNNLSIYPDQLSRWPWCPGGKLVRRLFRRKFSHSVEWKCGNPAAISQKQGPPC